jgi:hypothetical protein|tara:strand:+ start:2252 stop:2665 length:414 start_codon:yes stop_codon:yes gene_type:complete
MLTILPVSAFFHQRRDGFDAVEAAFDVDAKVVVPGLVVELLDGACQDRAYRVVHENVDLAELARCSLNRVVHLRRIADVAFDGKRATSALHDLSRDGLGPRHVDVSDGDRDALTRKSQRKRLAYSMPRAGNEGDFPG